MVSNLSRSLVDFFLFFAMTVGVLSSTIYTRSTKATCCGSVITADLSRRPRLQSLRNPLHIMARRTSSKITWYMLESSRVQSLLLPLHTIFQCLDLELSGLDEFFGIKTAIPERLPAGLSRDRTCILHIDMFALAAGFVAVADTLALERGTCLGHVVFGSN